MDVAAMDLGRGQNGAHGNRSEGEEGLEDAAHLGEADGGRDGLGDDGGEQPDLEKIGGHRRKTSSLPVRRSSFWILGLA